ncbi:peptidase [Pyrenophora tritici-repentis Pt-1C-BFP]|uniref:Peptidase n=1 Tax=Pyrenophora tritici-repentis (strain Pt-1C-BFP) TaxID=426418 RepID=B2WF67_PYRTR|nr:peptidase [Pyrenophora tritici-repentis Pt-1C-BFP]EDU51147.1 peptidase [Pyrenophora tritici-repentis Pt-1C-BFP]
MFVKYLVSVLLVSVVAARRPESVVPLSHIVEFEPGANREAILSDVRTKVTREFNSELLQGVTLQFANEAHEKAQLARLSSISSVKNIWSNKIVPPSDSRVTWTGPPGSADIQSNQATKRSSKNEKYSPHVMTQIDKLHAKNITGKDVKIAIIDSGIDYTLDALGGCLGHNCLVAGGYDFVGDKFNADGDSVPVPDNDPMDNCNGHGTHIAGIISARKNKYGFIGVAPVRYLPIRECDVASGNNVASIASFVNTIEPWLQSRSRYAIDHGQEQDFVYALAIPQNWGGVKLPLWTPSFDTSSVNMGCDPFPDNTPDLSGKIVLMRRGDCKSTRFLDKAKNAAAKGAKYLMFYNDVPGAIFLDLSEVQNISSVGMVEPGVGEQWTRDLAAGKTITLHMSDPRAGPINLAETPNTWNGGAVSDFSSWGPTYDLDFKPQFGAPGENILSTYPTALGSYASMSGTSMSCPMAAGIYALLIEARGTSDPLVLRNFLAATSKPALFNRNKILGSSLAPVAQQGAGLLQAYDAAYVVTALSEPSLAFNDTARLVDKHFTISNTGHKAITYQLDVVNAATAYTFSTTTSPDPFPKTAKVDDAHATVHLSTYKTTVPAGGKCSVTVKVTPPLAHAANLPVYGGYIRLNASNGERLSLPYQGVAADMSSLVVLNSTVSLKRSLPSNENVPISPNNSTFVLTRHVNDTSNDNDEAPFLTYQLNFGSPLVHVEIISVGNHSCNLGDVKYYPIDHYERTESTLLWFGQLKDNSSVPAGTYKMRVRAMHLFTTPKDNKYDIVDTVPFTIKYRRRLRC